MHFLACLAAAGELVEADGGDGAKEPDPGNDREEERHQRHVGRHHHCGKADQRVDEPGEEQVTTQVEKIVETLPKRDLEIIVGDLPNRDFGRAAASASSDGVGRHDTSF